MSGVVIINGYKNKYESGNQFITECGGRFPTPELNLEGNPKMEASVRLCSQCKEMITLLFYRGIAVIYGYWELASG